MVKTLIQFIFKIFLITLNFLEVVKTESFGYMQYEEGSLTSPGEWRTDGASMLPLETARSQLDDAKEIQKEFTAYFADEDEVEWQCGHL